MAKNKTNLEFYVIIWETNKKEVERFNVFSTLGPLATYEKQTTWADDIRNAVKKNKVNNRRELKEWLLRWFKSCYWSKCEYEILVDEWPASGVGPVKIDVFYQLEKNINVITDYVINQMKLNFD